MHAFCLENTFMRLIHLALFDLAFGWGEEWHKIIAYMAGQQLTEREATVLQRFMDWDDSDPEEIRDQLTSVSAWADTVGENWAYHTGHYREDEETGLLIIVCGSEKEKGCFWSGMKSWSRKVIDPEEPMIDRQNAMKYIIHIIADAFQPLHMGREKDWNGSKIRDVWDKYTWVEYGSPRYSLHQVWDTGLYYYDVLSRTLASDPGAVKEELLSNWRNGHRTDWRSTAKFLLSSYPLDACVLYDVRNPTAVRSRFRKIARESAVLARDKAYLDQNGEPIQSYKMLDIEYMDSRKVIVRDQVVKAAGELACFLKEIILALDMLEVDRIQEQLRPLIEKLPL
jgi:hypothetical protein